MINLNTALDQQLLHVPIRQAIAQIQRTATVITSERNRKPANADRDTGIGRWRDESLTDPSSASTTD